MERLRSVKLSIGQKYVIAVAACVKQTHGHSGQGHVQRKHRHVRSSFLVMEKL